MKVIKVKKCRGCPYIREDDGGGHCDGYLECTKYNIMLEDYDGYAEDDFDVDSGIHPKCKLEDA
jgi:hypothetical protein